MRIAYLINQYPKVSHTFIRREILALEKQGVAIRRYALRGWDEKVPDNIDEQEKAKTIYVLNKGLVQLFIAVLWCVVNSPWLFIRAGYDSLHLIRSSNRPVVSHLAYFAEACWMKRECNRAKVTHLHAHFGTNVAAVALLIDALGGPTYSFTIHGPEEFDHQQALSLSFKVRRAQFVAVVSSFGKSQLLRWVDASDRHKIEIIRCGLNEDYFANSPAAVPDNSSFVCVARLEEQKGLLVLLSAVEQVVASGCSVKVVLAGDGTLRSEIEDEIKRKGLASSIRLIGWASGDVIRQLIIDSRSMVVPSFAEGLPVVIMEAMALKRPVITTYIAGIPELVENGVNGWLVPAGDANALASQLQQCLETPNQKLQDMGEKAKDSVYKMHRVDNSAEKLVARFLTCEAR
jgi:colanic acid/amylovoran biosynthesis glycosyltransferase